MAKTSLWAAFLERNQPDPRMRKRLRLVAGRASQGNWNTPIVHAGVGATGKSTFVRVVAAAHPASAHLHETTNVQVNIKHAVVVPWDVVIPWDEQDPTLARKIIDNEFAIVRAWLREV